jgi:hydroxyacylglutathione hydrolase
MDIVNNRDLRIEELMLSRWEVNSFIVVCKQTNKSVLIDVPPGALTLIKSLEGADLQYVLLTHGHIDHIAGLPAFKNRMKVPIAAHAGDVGWMEFPPDRLLNDGDVLSVGNIKIEVMYTPGHTPGSVCFKIGKYLISGDTLFPGGPGRTETPAEFQQILKSLNEKVFTLPDDTGVYPGHGDSTNLKKEKAEYAVFASKPHGKDLSGDIVWLTS